MKPHNPDRNQGEGDRESARRYNRDVHHYVAEGKVDEAARDAKQYVERDPRDAAHAEAKARRGPHGGTRASVDELIAKSRTVLDRVQPVFERVAARLDRLASRIRSRLSRK
jgi:hypothetical protein